MGTTIHEIYLISNVEQKLARMGAAHAVYNAELKSSSINLADWFTRMDAYSSRKLPTTVSNINSLRNSIDGMQRSLHNNNLLLKLMGGSSHTAGMNVGMLSLRIAEGLIPMLLLAYSAMLPVIAGLLLIASAAIAATLGLAGLMGIGLYKWSKEFKGTNMGYAGARRPYSSNTRTKSFWSEVFSPFADSLNDASVKSKIDSAVKWTKKVFADDLPNAFSKFVHTLAAGDFSGIKMIMDKFTSWLPEAAVGLASWGQTFMNEVGSTALTKLNNFFKYLAAGLMNTAKWLNAGGWDDLDDFFSVLSKIISKLLELGKSVLPVFNHSLESIYPYPLEPLIDSLTDLFDSIKDNDAAMEAVKWISRALAFLGVLWLTAKVVGTGLAAYNAALDAAAFLTTPGLAAAAATTIAGIATSLGQILLIALLATALYDQLKYGGFVGIIELAFAAGMVIYDVFAIIGNMLEKGIELLTGWDLSKDRFQLYDPTNAFASLNNGKIELFGGDFTDYVIPDNEKEGLLDRARGYVGIGAPEAAQTLYVTIDPDWNLAGSLEGEGNATFGTNVTGVGNVGARLGGGRVTRY